MKPAFSPWLRRIDPLLAAEDTNTLFQAFRLRRTEHARSWRTWLRRRGSLPPGQIAMLAVFLAVAVGLLWVMNCCAIPLILGIGAVLARSFQRTRIVGGRLPARLSGVFATTGFMEEAALDLWLSGATGREVLEAVYLEHRERTWRVSLGITFFLVGFSFLGYLAEARPWHAGGYVVFVAVTCLSAALVPFILAAGISATRKNHLEPRLGTWLADGGLGGAVRAGLARAGLAFLAVMGVFFLLWVAIMVLSIGGSLVGDFLDDHPNLWNLIPSPVRTHTEEFFVAAVLGGLAMLFRFLWAPLARRSTARVKRTLEDADMAFDRFMASVVANDPEGADWARWAHYRRENPAPLHTLAPQEHPVGDGSRPGTHPAPLP